MALRLLFEQPEHFELVQLNDLGATESTAYLLKYDSVHDTWPHSSTAEGDFIVLRSAKDGRVLRVPYSRAKEPAALASAYKAAGVALVLVRVVLCCCTSPAHWQRYRSARASF